MAKNDHFSSPLFCQNEQKPLDFHTYWSYYKRVEGRSAKMTKNSKYADVWEYVETANASGCVDTEGMLEEGQFTIAHIREAVDASEGHLELVDGILSLTAKWGEAHGLVYDELYGQWVAAPAPSK